MATNIALKRAKKAIRRKAVLAEKRKAEALEATLTGRVRQAAGAPIRHCLLTDGLFEVGVGMLILARGVTTRQFAMGGFLIDVFCLGIKDVMFRSPGAEEFEMYIDSVSAMEPLAPVDPAYARKLLRDLAAWAGSIGFAPHPQFGVVERLFGDVDAASCDAAFQFGRDGKPLYMPGPTESPTVVRRRLDQLRKQFGDDGFDLIAPV